MITNMPQEREFEGSHSNLNRISLVMSAIATQRSEQKYV